MKNIHILFFVLSFVLLTLACSALSMSSVASQYRFYWVAMNPWNGVEGIAFTIRHFLHTTESNSLLLAIGLLVVVWWRIYALLCRAFKR